MAVALGKLPFLSNPRLGNELHGVNERLRELEGILASAPPARPLHRRTENLEYMDRLTNVRRKEELRGELAFLKHERRRLLGALNCENPKAIAAVWTGRSPATVSAWLHRSRRPGPWNEPTVRVSPPAECFYVLDGVLRGLLPIHAPPVTGPELATMLELLGTSKAEIARQLWIGRATLSRTPLKRVPMWWGCAILLSVGHPVEPLFRDDRWRNA